jgi:hypothetical protein
MLDAQENYAKVRPAVSRAEVEAFGGDQMAAAAARCAAAADALSDLDLVDRTLMSTQSWSLLPLEACLAVSAGTALSLVILLCVAALIALKYSCQSISRYASGRFSCAWNAPQLVQRAPASRSSKYGMEVSGAFGENEYTQQTTQATDGDAHCHAGSKQWRQDGLAHLCSSNAGVCQRAICSRNVLNDVSQVRSVCRPLQQKGGDGAEAAIAILDECACSRHCVASAVLLCLCRLQVPFRQR